MASLNQVNLIGNLGRDPELRHLANGDPVTNFSIACSESWKDKNTGEKKEQTEWVNIAVYGRLAEIASQYLRKGSQVFISGKLRTRKWQDKDGNDRYTTEVICNDMKMLGSRPDGAQGGGGYGGGQQRQAPQQTQQRQAQPAARQQQPAFDDDSIPF